MAFSKTPRSAISLLELLIVIAILGVLIGLLLGAVQKVRAAGVELQNKNNLRQMAIGTHQLFSEDNGKLSKLMKSSMADVTVFPDSLSLFSRLLPFVHHAPTFHEGMSIAEFTDNFRPNAKVFRNPADPSYEYEVYGLVRWAKCSYALNIHAMDGSVDLNAAISDGTSQTMMLADKYYSHCDRESTFASTYNEWSHVFDPFKGEYYSNRRPTFADRGWHDVMPVTDLGTGVTRPSVPGKTFQVRPRPEDVDPSILQTCFHSGLTVAFFDGSVRTIRPGIDETVYWAMITHNGGEVISVD